MSPDRNRPLPQRNNLHIGYHGRTDDETRPGRLLEYPQHPLRSFAVENITAAKALLQGRCCRDMPDHELDEHYAASSGIFIFAGHPERQAVLHFTPEHACW